MVFNRRSIQNPSANCQQIFEKYSFRSDFVCQGATVTFFAPRWLDVAKRCIQSAWSKQRDCVLHCHTSWVFWLILTEYTDMESQMVQNSRNKIGLTFNKFVIRVKGDFNQPQQNQFTFNRFSLKVNTFRIKLNKIMSPLSRNYLSRTRDIWVKLKRSLPLLSTKNLSQFHASFHINPKFPITFQQLDLSRSSRECCQQPR